MSRTMEMLLWALPAILGWGLYGVLAKMGIARIGMQAIFWSPLVTLVGSVVFLALLRDLLPLTWDGPGIFLGLSMGLSSLVAVVALFTLLQRGFPVSIVYPLTALYPLVTVILGVAFLGETLTLVKGLGVVMAVIAIILLSA